MELEIYSKDVKGINDVVITTFTVALPYLIPKEGLITIGVDPGVTNIGLAEIYPDLEHVALYKIEIPRSKDAMKRMVIIQSALHHCLYPVRSFRATIEGASFGAKYRQVELAEARAAIALWLNSKGAQVKIVPPNTIRKQVFGNGKIKNPWDNLNDDVAAALGAAYYGYK